jgi:hypothetical protein
MVTVLAPGPGKYAYRIVTRLPSVRVVSLLCKMGTAAGSPWLAVAAYRRREMKEQCVALDALLTPKAVRVDGLLTPSHPDCVIVRVCDLPIRD